MKGLINNKKFRLDKSELRNIKGGQKEKLTMKMFDEEGYELAVHR